MCGRFVINLSPDMVAKVFGLADRPDLPPRYNVAPTQLVPVIREASDGSRRLSLMRWGLVPAWSKEFGAGLINARSETVNEKPSFRQAFQEDVAKGTSRFVSLAAAVLYVLMIAHGSLSDTNIVACG